MEKLKRYLVFLLGRQKQVPGLFLPSHHAKPFSRRNSDLFWRKDHSLSFFFALSSSWFLCFGIPSIDKVPPPGPLPFPHWVPIPSPDASSCQNWLSSVDPACRESFIICVSPLVPDHLSGHQLWMRWKLIRNETEKERFRQVLPSRRLDTAGFTESLSSWRLLFSSSLG